MLNIVTQSSVVKPLAPVEMGWALVRTSAKDPWQSLKVPFTIGHHTDNDIFVNAPSMRAISRVVLVHDGSLAAVDAQTLDLAPMKDLKLFGIELLGPFEENPQNMSIPQRTLNRFLSAEAAWYAGKCPEFTRKALPKKQGLRLVAMSGLFAAFSAMFVTMLNGEEQIPDLSTTLIRAHLGDITAVGISSRGSGESYAKGATISFVTDSEKSPNPYVLSAVMSGLDVADELEFVLNGKTIGFTEAQIACVDSMCTKDFRIDADIIDGKMNTLVVQHHAPHSSYVLKSVYLRSIEPASPDEIEQMKQLMTAAERYYDERLLLVQNIRNAQEAIREVKKLVDTRSGIDDLRPRFTLAEKKINMSFDETTEDLKFKMQKELKLDHVRPALAVIGDMLKLYPDPTSSQNIFLTQHKKKLEAKLK